MKTHLYAPLAAALLLTGCRGMVSENSPIHPNPNMDWQEKFEAQEANPLFADNRSMRLVGDVDPLEQSDLPRDNFERDALAAAKLGQNFSRTERSNGRWYVRKSIAVATTFSPSCVHCHDNFVGLANPWVGALMVKAKVD